MGSTREQVGAQLEAWQAAGHLAGPEHCGIVATIEAAAVAVDHAMAECMDGGATNASKNLTYTTQGLARLLAKYQPAVVEPGLDDLVAVLKQV